MIAGGLAPLGSQLPPLEPHAVARAILSEPRFRVRVARSHAAWWHPLAAWLDDRWRALAHLLHGRVHVGAGFAVAIGDVLVVAAIAIVLFAAIRLLANIAGDSVPANARPRGRDGRAGARALHGASVEAAERGEYGAAVALLFRAALCALDVRGVLRDDPSATVDECRRAVRRTEPAAAVPFDELARVFTAALYAGAPIGRAQWSAAQAAYASVTGGNGNAT